jgi:hypothetical protein
MQTITTIGFDIAAGPATLDTYPSAFDRAHRAARWKPELYFLIYPLL